jgi:hypothetical protein
MYLITICVVLFMLDQMYVPMLVPSSDGYGSITYWTKSSDHNNNKRYWSVGKSLIATVAVGITATLSFIHSSSYTNALTCHIIIVFFIWSAVIRYPSPTSINDATNDIDMHHQYDAASVTPLPSSSSSVIPLTSSYVNANIASSSIAAAAADPSSDGGIGIGNAAADDDDEEEEEEAIFLTNGNRIVNRITNRVSVWSWLLYPLICQFLWYQY